MRILTVFLSIVIFGHSLDASEKIVFNSQSTQDEFVYTILYDLLGKRDAGFYLEIGAGDPIHINNSYAFEKHCGWKGLSIDISPSFIPLWHKARNNPLLLKDATQLDYGSILEGFPQVMDYLSLDIDGLYDTVLRKVMHSNHIFKVITIEHDAYRYGDIYRNKEREILAAYGYYLLCSDVSNDGSPYEDWWIHPNFFPSSLLQKLTALDLKGKDHMELIKNIKVLTTN